jgi:hypothetical protein
MPTPEQIEKWTSEGHWPPPDGLQFLETRESSAEGQARLWTQLGRVLLDEQLKEVRMTSPISSAIARFLGKRDSE